MPEPGACLGVILAGGQARRMGGGDKALLPLGNGRVIDHVLSRLRPQVTDMVLNANGDAARFGDLALSVVPDPVPGFPGPLAGVLAGMQAARARGLGWVLSVAADTPFFPTDLRARLAAAIAADTAPLALAETPDPARGWVRQPVFGLWSVALAAPLEQAIAAGTSKVVQFTQPHGAARARFDDAGAFFNINTPEDLKTAQARAEVRA